MKSELIVDARPDEVSIALLEDTRLMSLQKESRNIAYAVGDIYKALCSQVHKKEYAGLYTLVVFRICIGNNLSYELYAIQCFLFIHKSPPYII